MPKIWFITGISSGFGQCLLEQVIKSGDYVIGTLRNKEAVDEFNKKYAGKAESVLMDVTNPEQIISGVRVALASHGRIDVLVNNAGYGLFGAVEEVGNDEARAQMETNFFGALALTQAVLPIMRKQKSGTIVQISSVAGFCSMPALGIYNASKFALEGFSEALAQEVSPLGIKVLIVEPGPYRTKWAGDSSTKVSKNIADYENTAHAVTKQINGYSGSQPGDPEKAAKLIIKVVNSDNMPLRLPLGQIAIDRIRAKMANLQKEIEAWEKESIATAFES